MGMARRLFLTQGARWGVRPAILVLTSFLLSAIIRAFPSSFSMPQPHYYLNPQDIEPVKLGFMARRQVIA